MDRAESVHSAVLKCHPQTPSQAVQGIEARVGWAVAGELTLTYALEGDIARLRIPSAGPVRKADCLWQHTCFEAFICAKGNTAYYEFNFAPSREWAAYAFRRYRDGALFDDEEITPSITVSNTVDSLDLRALIYVNRLPTIQPGAWLRLGLSAVVEDDRGMLSYWALKHRPDKPDFHHPDTFTLEIEPPPEVKAVNKSAMARR